MDGDTGELGAAPFHFAGVYPDAYLEADLPGGVTDRGSAADRARGAVEGGEHAVAGEPTLRAGEPIELTTDRVVVEIEHRTPRAIADGDDPVRRTYDVGEHERREHPPVAAHDARAGHELFDRVGHDLLRVPA